MRKIVLSCKADILLLLTFAIFVVIIKFCYPVPEITWDSDSYINISQYLQPNNRPIGYAVFLAILYTISKSLSFVVYSQFFIYLFSALVLLKVVKKYWRLNFLQYYFLGVLILIEPAALYNCNTILSDILFSCLTYLYLATLILYTSSKKFSLLIIHILLLCLCILTRHIALFYSFFTVLIFIIYLKKFKRIFSIVLVFAAFFVVYKNVVDWNSRTYRVAIYSPFTGWNQANNVLYALRHIHLNPESIQDEEIRELQLFFSAYLDTTSYKPYEVGSGYLWDARSPLNIIRMRLEDSLKNEKLPSDLTFTWYLLAPKYARYSSFIIKNYPYQYFKGFIIPNIKSLLKPNDAEMADYYTAKNGISTESLKRYNLTANMLYCNKQLYKDYINPINLFFYQIRLLSLVLAIFYLLFSREAFNDHTKRTLFILITFIIIFYLLSLSSSWFLPRYLIPVLPLMSVVIFICFLNILQLKGRRIAPCLPNESGQVM